MVNIPDSFYNGLYTNKFKRLIEEVNILEAKLSHYSSEEGANEVLKEFMNMWIKDGIV